MGLGEPSKHPGDMVGGQGGGRNRGTGSQGGEGKGGEHGLLLEEVMVDSQLSPRFPVRQPQKKFPINMPSSKTSFTAPWRGKAQGGQGRGTPDRVSF